MEEMNCFSCGIMMKIPHVVQANDRNRKAFCEKCWNHLSSQTNKPTNDRFDMSETVAIAIGVFFIAISVVLYLFLK